MTVNARGIKSIDKDRLSKTVIYPGNWKEWHYQVDLNSKEHMQYFESSLVIYYV